MKKKEGKASNKLIRLISGNERSVYNNLIVNWWGSQLFSKLPVSVIP